MSDPTIISRNQIFNALLALGAATTWGAGAFKTSGRKYRDPTDFSPAELPALIQLETTEQAASTTGMPYTRSLDVVWLVYFATDATDPTDVGAAVMADILDALQASLAATGPDDNQTLGGLVHNVAISDMIYKVAGDDTGAGMIVVPLRIIAP